MKILYIHALYAPYYGGGAEVTLKTLVEGMQNKGHDVAVLTLSPNGDGYEEYVDNIKVIRRGINNIYWPLTRDKPAVWKRFLWHFRDIDNSVMSKIIVDVIKKEKPDVVSCHNLSGWSVSAWKAVKQCNTPLLQVLHDLYNICPNSNMFKNGHACSSQCASCKLFRFPHTKLSANVNAVVGVSAYILNRHLDSGLFQKAMIKKSIKNVRNAQLTLYKNKSKRNIRFGFIGTLTEAKGIELLLQVFERLAGNAELTVAGTGKNDYVRYLKNTYEGEIKFEGQVDPGQFYPKIDVLVVPSLWHEALGMVVAEAFSYGIPVIGSQRGGIPEMISEGINGFLFDPELPDQLLALIDLFIENPGKIEEMRNDVFESAKPFLDIQGWLSEYNDIYSLLVEAHK